MTLRLARSLYRTLIRLHPPAFRRHFGGEMLLVFDEAAEACGALWLLGDAAASLARQWVLRPGEQETAASYSVGLMSGVYLDLRSPRLTAGKLTLAALLSLLLVTLMQPYSMEGWPVKKGAHHGIVHSSTRVPR